MEPIQRQPVGVPGWNDRAAVALLVVVARHLLAVEAGPLTPDRLARFVGAYQDDLPALVAALEDSPSAPVREGAQQLRRLIRAGQAQVYQRVLPGLPVALADPFFRLDLARRPSVRSRPLPTDGTRRVSARGHERRPGGVVGRRDHRRAAWDRAPLIHHTTTRHAGRPGTLWGETLDHEEPV